MQVSTTSLSAAKLLLFLVIAAIVFVAIGIIILGQMVDRPLESVMILHDFFTVFALITGAGFIGVLAFSSERHPDAVNALKILSISAAASVFIIEFTGTIGYIEYRLPDPDSAKSQIKQTFPYAHAPMFETMEYVGLFGTVWAGLIAYLAWHYGERMFTSAAIKNTLVILISLAIMYALFISLMGIVPTKIASVQG
jgi:hypothetical protein